MKYILIAFSFFACQSISRHHNSPKVSTEVLDTIKPLPGRVVATPTLFETAFNKGTTQSLNDKILHLYGVTIGKIKIVSGHIIACDPMHIDEYGIPFTQAFPTGEFPVQLSIAKLDNAETIAFARINFGDESVSKWEFALLEGQAPIAVGGEEMHGYGVDGGVGIFVDEQASQVLDKKKAENMDAEVFKEMEKHYHDRWKYTMYNFGKHNLAAFSTGLGDGRYATYIGFDAKGKPCRLVTDFGIIDWKKK